MRRTASVWAAASLLLCSAAGAASRSAPPWDLPSPVNPDTAFFEESERTKKDRSEKPVFGDKHFPWYCLEKGNEHFLRREYDRAAVFFKEAYSVPGPTRVLSGFKLVDAYQQAGRTDSALEVLEQMERQTLVSSREFAEAKRLKMALLDRKRAGAPEEKPPAFTGREWVLQVSEQRLRYVLGAMEALRARGVPLKESAQKYVFWLDEYFLANPEAPARDAAAALGAVVYEQDPGARNAVDRVRLDPDAPAAPASGKMTGAEWITLVHNDKMEYVSGAMDMLQRQRVPMEKGVYAYVDALDRLFTEKPELPASDSVAALASLLHATEPRAREILDVLRLE